MRRLSHGWVVSVLIGMLFWQVDSFGETQNDKDLLDRTNALLVSYATFKDYPSKDASTTYANLTQDRRAVFDSIVRALFIPIEDKKGNVGKRVIDYVEGVHGIWGVRNNDGEGRHMFRLSLRFSSSLKAALLDSSNIPKSVFTTGHVLLAKKKGGDDDPKFTDFKELLIETGVTTFREAADPSMQISLLNSDPRVGEVDIDFDKKTVFCGCHCKPSNSDVGSKATGSSTDIHLTLFNGDVPYFSTALAVEWSKPAAHCKDKY